MLGRHAARPLRVVVEVDQLQRRVFRRRKRGQHLPQLVLCRQDRLRRRVVQAEWNLLIEELDGERNGDTSGHGEAELTDDPLGASFPEHRAGVSRAKALRKEPGGHLPRALARLCKAHR